MRSGAVPALLSALLVADSVVAHPADLNKRTVDTRYPYTGPEVPIGDWVDNTINGNGKGFPRLVEPPAVTPSSKDPTNNINVIQISYLPNGINIHFQTPFGIGADPYVMWGTSSSSLTKKATGITNTFARTPSCGAITAVTQCSEFFHNVAITGLSADTEYYYKIPGGNGTTESGVLSFKTARTAGDKTAFSVAILNDMGYTNAHGTKANIEKMAESGDIAFAWHGGDTSYADDWYSGILPCTDHWPVCYNGSDTRLPNGKPYPPEYLNTPLPAGEVPNQGGPQGGDYNVIYESNWDLWQNWMTAITMKIPYMILPGNHEAACAEFDGGHHEMTAYLNKDEKNSTADADHLNYFSCPPSQRNFTGYQNRFRMPGNESGGVGNFWYSFDYGLAHFISLDSETDFPYSPEYSFLAETDGKTYFPNKSETYITDSGPFGYIRGDWTENDSYEQIAWLKKDIASVDKTKTPWIIAMGHRPMYSSQVDGYQTDVRNAFEKILIDGGADMYLAGHIHWYERLRPLTVDGKVNQAAITSHNKYTTDPGTSLVHVVNGMAGNIESHSTLEGDPRLAITAVLDDHNYGFSKVTFNSETSLTWQFILGDGNLGDEFTLTKKS